MNLLKKFNNFIWSHTKTVEYKSKETSSKPSFNGISRQNIIHNNDNICFDFRYFECQKDGYTSLEKHAHTHIVMILQGSGEIFIKDKIYKVNPFDVITIPPNSPHQLFNNSLQPFGFICIVNKERDLPKLISKESLSITDEVYKSLP